MVTKKDQETITIRDGVVKEMSIDAMEREIIGESLTGEIETRTGIVEETMTETEGIKLVIGIITGNVTLTGTVDRIGTRTDIVIENENLAIVRKIAKMWEPGNTLLCETNMVVTGILRTEMIGKIAVEETGGADKILLFVVEERMKAGREYTDVAELHYVN